MTHSPDLHVIELEYPMSHNLVTIDAPRANLHVGRCPCGATTVRPYEPELIELMREEWGTGCVVDKTARDYILSVAYDPIERNDFADGEVWPEAVGA